MIQTRPGAVTAAGVLSIIYGSLFTLCGLCGVASLVAQGSGADMGAMFGGGGDAVQKEMQKRIQEEVQKAMERDAPAYNAYQIGSAILGLAEAVAFLIVGIGLVRMSPWSRGFGLTLCAITIFTTIVQAIYQLAFVMPAMRSAFQVVLPAAGPVPAEALRMMQNIMTIMSVVMVIIYAVVVFYILIILLLLSRGHVREAFAAAARGDFDRPAPDEFEPRERLRPQRDEGDEDWRYRPPEGTPPGGPPDDRIR